MVGHAAAYAATAVLLLLAYCSGAHAGASRRNAAPAPAARCQASVAGARGQVFHFATEVPRDRTRLLLRCPGFSRNTCCNVTHTLPIARDLQLMELGGASEQCRAMTEAALCASCHPDVGTGAAQGVCGSFCRRWYKACANDFFAFARDGSAAPCAPDALVCSQLSAAVPDASAWCAKMGVAVVSDGDLLVGRASRARCYRGKPPRGRGVSDKPEEAPGTLSSAAQWLRRRWRRVVRKIRRTRVWRALSRLHVLVYVALAVAAWQFTRSRQSSGGANAGNTATAASLGAGASAATAGNPNANPNLANRRRVNFSGYAR